MKTEIHLIAIKQLCSEIEREMGKGASSVTQPMVEELYNQATDLLREHKTEMAANYFREMGE